MSLHTTQSNATFRRIGSSGTSKIGDSDRCNMADALATYWRRVSILLTVAVYKRIAKITQFHESYVILEKSASHVFFIFYSKNRLAHLFYVAGSDRCVP